MAEKIYFYPLWLRVWHGLNALLFIVLIATGISLQYSSPDYPIIRFDLAVTWHNIAGVLLTVNYLVFLIGNLTTSNGRFYKTNFKGIGPQLIKQMRYYTFGMFRGEPKPFPLNPERKFNPLQKITYLLAMFIGMPLIFFTGWALLFPEIIIEKVFGGSGIFMTVVLHIIIGFLLSIFMIVHIYLATVGNKPSENFRSIINGWHDIH